MGTVSVKLKIIRFGSYYTNNACNDIRGWLEEITLTTASLGFSASYLSFLLLTSFSF